MCDDKLTLSTLADFDEMFSLIIYLYTPNPPILPSNPSIIISNNPKLPTHPKTF